MASRWIDSDPRHDGGKHFQPGRASAPTGQSCSSTLAWNTSRSAYLTRRSLCASPVAIVPEFELSTKSPAPCPSRWSEPESSRSQGRGRLGGGCGVCGQVEVQRRSGLPPACGRCDRPGPGEPFARSEAAIVTSERSGVVTRAVILETARVTGGISG